MTEERIKALDELGFEWNGQKHLAKGQARSFEQHVENLKAFKEAHGHLHVTNAVDKKLASFCSNMRHARRKPTSTGTMNTEERCKALDELGFEWNAQHQLTKVQTLSAETKYKCASFKQRIIEQLKALKEAHGHLNFTNTLDRNLSSFCRHRRQVRWNPDSTDHH